MTYQGYEKALNSLTKNDYVELKKKAKNGKYSEILAVLAEKGGQELTPRDVLTEARDPKSLLHKAFLWDNDKAGERYRLMQARILISRVRVTIEGSTKPAYFNARVTLAKGPVQAYFPIERVENETNIHQAVLKNAVRELRHALEKYRAIAELNGIINEKLLAQVEDSLREVEKTN